MEFTRDDFKSLIHIKNSIKRLEEESERIASRAEPGGFDFERASMPRSTDIFDIVGETATDKAEIKEKIDEAKARAKEEYERIFDLIESVPDKEMHDILYYRYAKAMSWEEVAKEVGSTYDGVISKDKRFFTRKKEA